MDGGLDIRNAGFNISAPGANTNILSSSITPRYGSALRVTVCLATSSVFNVTMTQGSTTFTCGLNSSVALTAGDLFTFVFGANTSTAYNFQIETNGVVNILQIDEVSTGVI